MKRSHDNEKGISRRDFIVGTAKTIAGLSALPIIGEGLLGASAVLAAPSGSVVCLVQSKSPIPEGDAAKAVFSKMLEEGLKAIAKGADSNSFMKGLFNAKDKVAIKVNANTYKPNRGPQLAEAVCDRIRKAGVKAENIVIYENSDIALKRAGYKLNHDKPGVKCYGNDHSGFMEKETVSGACKTHFTKVLDRCTALVNIPVMKSHTMSGVTICLKNHYGSIDNPRDMHTNDCDPYIADLNTADIIRKKHRLAVCDATKVLYAGGPEWMENWGLDYNGIFVSTDPVALDSVGAKIMAQMRKKSGKKPLPYNPAPKKLKTAEKNGIGIADLNKIEFIQLTI